MNEKTYLCIDLKCFYASVECAARGLDPFTANLVVADPARSRGAICLAISPAMKALGVRNRCRIFEIPPGVKYITALPRMKRYMEVSACIYGIYLNYISAEDIHVYSIDECFIDATPYMHIYGKSGEELAVMLMQDVLEQTGISASAGIGDNLFLAKVALDITAKHSVGRIGRLDEETFKETIWHHRPITDIWNIGRGTADRLAKRGIYDLYGVAHADEKMLYRLFGINAAYLIDHAHGREKCTIGDIRNFKTKNNSLSTNQILFEDYTFDEALLALIEMADILTLELVEKRLVTGGIALSVGYGDKETASTGGSRKLEGLTNSAARLTERFTSLYRETTHRDIPVRRLAVGFTNVVDESFAGYDFFADTQAEAAERRVQDALIDIKNRYGKNAIIRCMSLQPKATAIKRNKLIGGHNGE